MVQSQTASVRTLADSMRGNGRALEAMPYALIKELESIAMDLDIAQWDDEDGFVSELGSLLIQVREWLSKLPRDV